MKIEELKHKHLEILPYECTNKHSKLSIEFAISVLEDFIPFYIGDGLMIDAEEVNNKIQELKTYLKDE